MCVCTYVASRSSVTPCFVVDVVVVVVCVCRVFQLLEDIKLCESQEGSDHG